MGADEANDRFHVDGAKAGGNFERGFRSDGNLDVAAEQAAIETQDADG